MRPSAKDDRDFLNAMQDFAVSADELAAAVKMPALSIREIKQGLPGYCGDRRTKSRHSPATHAAP